ncbi:MAG: hypothetical protein KME42_00405 [Tildeniella nuda ZEHNDER 1965/U140]|jgi:hypothetical protein|nr:hypothetical protein [Tildeniella nuda ZEHNDER 1965/U140]
MNLPISDAILITKHEAARILGIHHTTFRYLRNNPNAAMIEGLHWVVMPFADVRKHKL